MLNFARSLFRAFVEIVLFLNLVFCSVAGGVIGNQSDHPIIGVIIGLIAGIVLDVIFGGYIATILNIDENLEQIKNGMSNISGSSALNKGKLSPIGNIQENKKCRRCGKSVDSGYTSCPHCGTSDFE
jgi:hypothetical protein